VLSTFLSADRSLDPEVPVGPEEMPWVVGSMLTLGVSMLPEVSSPRIGPTLAKGGLVDLAEKMAEWGDPVETVRVAPSQSIQGKRLFLGQTC
jgi:hypothetical protein